MTFIVQLFPDIDDCPTWWTTLIDKYDNDAITVNRFLQEHATIHWIKHQYKGNPYPIQIIDTLEFPSELHYNLFVLKI